MNALGVAILTDVWITRERHQDEAARGWLSDPPAGWTVVGWNGAVRRFEDEIDHFARAAAAGRDSVDEARLARLRAAARHTCPICRRGTR